MNVSAAKEFAGFTDIILGSKFGSFVHSPTRSVDLTPESVRSKICALNAVPNQDPSNCEREYYIPGETIFTMPEALMDPSNPEADILLVGNHRGHNFRYGVGDLNQPFNLDKNCRLYYGRYWGFNIGGFLLCMVNATPNTIQASTSPGIHPIFLFSWSFSPFLGPFPQLTVNLHRNHQMPRKSRSGPDMPYYQNLAILTLLDPLHDLVLPHCHCRLLPSQLYHP